MNDRESLSPLNQQPIAEAILQSVGEGIIAVDRDATIVSFNASAELMTQWSKDKAIGQSVDAVICANKEITGERYKVPIQRVLDLGILEGSIRNLLLIGRGGSETPITGSISPIVNGEGQVAGAVFVFRSVGDIHTNERRFQYMIEQITDHVIFMTDPAGIVTSWNQGVESLLGYQEHEFVGKHVSGLIFTDEAIAEGVPDWEFETSKEKGSAIDDRWMKRKDGSHFWASGIMTALRDEADKVIGFNKIMRDLTEQKTNLDAIRNLNHELTHAQIRKDDFIATLAHELRNPLTPLTSALSLMEDGLESPDRVREFQSIAKTQVGQLVRLVEDLLDVSRIGQGKVELKLAVCELATIIEQAVASCRSFIDDSSQKLTVKLVNRPMLVTADSARLVQVITNVLNNSAKYTPEGGNIELLTDADEHWTTIVVRDDGIGIPQDQLKLVFDLFAQANPTAERGKAGLGIGLALVKRIVDLHGGSVTIDSDGVGHGTIVTVKLKTASSTLKSDSIDMNVSGEANSEAYRLDVLVIDDSRAITLTLGRLIEKLGHQVRTAESGELGLKMIEEHRPDVVISDISMPGMNGYDVAYQIRSHFGETMMLVAMTGYSNEAARQRALEAGFDRHMVKPPDIRELKLVFESFQISQARVNEQQRPGKSLPNE